MITCNTKRGEFIDFFECKDYKSPVDATLNSGISIGHQGILGHAHEQIQRFAEMNAKLGGLFTKTQAGLLLGLTKQRVGQLVDEGRLHIHEFALDQGGEREVVGRYISGHELQAYLVSEKRACGRPSKFRLIMAGVQTK